MAMMAITTKISINVNAEQRSRETEAENMKNQL